MSDDKNFGFCPRCGTLMQNGICQSCRYGKRLGQTEVQEPVPVSGSSAMQTKRQSPTPQKSKKLVVGLCIGGGVLLFLGLMAAIVFYFAMIFKGVSTVGSHQQNDSHYSDDYDDDYEYYEPSEDDPYYKEIVDATSTELSYTVSWATDSLYPDNSDVNWSYYATYPVLEAAEGETGNYDGINEAIRNAALIYKASFREHDGGANTYGYVTYMDEETISVVFQHSLYESYGMSPSIDALNFEVKTGRRITPEEMTELDETLAMRFRAQDQTQNGGVAFVQDLSDEELLAYLQDPERAVAFYTPVGLEVGFNYETGWVTVTLKEKAL